MSTHRWSEIRSLFDELVELDDVQRTARLALLEERDPELCTAVRSMLRHDASGNERLNQLNDGVANLLRRISVDMRPDVSYPATVAQFQIIERVAAGGMGIVYRALDTHLGRTVALKFPLQQNGEDADSETRKRFLREARSASVLDHPNLCPVYEAGETDAGLLYIAMPFYDGRTLREALAEAAPLPIERALEIARQAAAGLACAHASGIVHRDLKPGNLMVLPDGSVKVLDFGLATAADLSRTVTRSTAGTPAYMSPEQISGANVDHRADLWALGVLLYEMTTGARPFDGENEWSTAQRVLKSDPPLPSSVRAEIPSAVENLILHLLQKDPSDRYHTAEAVLQDITAIQQGQLPVTLKRRPRRTRLPWRGRQRTIAFVASIALLASVGVSARLLTMSAQEIRPATTADGQAGAAAAKGLDELSPMAVAVLPFTNAGGDERNQYYSDGLTEQLTTALSHIGALRVVDLSSAFKFRSENADVRAVGRALRVGTVVQGEVHRVGGRTRLSVQVSSARDGSDVWSQAYELQGADVLSVQSELARLIADALEAGLTPAERARIAHRLTNNVEAYDFYLKGVHFGHQRTEDALRRANEYFEKATAIDPEFAAAYADLANIFPPLAAHGFIDPREARERMRMPALKAVALDPGLAEAQVALAAYLTFFEWDWQAGEQAFRRAIAIDPNNMRAHGWYSYLLTCLQRYDEALREAKIEAELSPLGPYAAAAAQVQILSRDTSGHSLALIRKALSVDSTTWLLHRYAGWAHEMKKEWSEAIRAYERAGRFSKSTSIPRADLARVLAITGRTTEARDILENLRREGGRTGVYLPHVATVFAALGETDAAIEWIERSASQRHTGFPHAVVEPGFESLGHHPRFVALLRRYQLPL